DQFTFILGSFGKLDGRTGSGAAAYAGQDSFLLVHAARKGDGVVVCDRDHLIDDGEVEDIRHEAGADALNLVRARFDRLACHGLRDDRAVSRLDRHALRGRFSRLDDLTDAGDRAAGAHAGDEYIDLSVGVPPDFLGGNFAVNLGIG